MLSASGSHGQWHNCGCVSSCVPHPGSGIGNCTDCCLSFPQHCSGVSRRWQAVRAQLSFCFPDHAKAVTIGACNMIPELCCMHSVLQCTDCLSSHPTIAACALQEVTRHMLKVMSPCAAGVSLGRGKHPERLPQRLGQLGGPASSHGQAASPAARHQGAVCHTREGGGQRQPAAPAGRPERQWLPGKRSAAMPVCACTSKSGKPIWACAWPARLSPCWQSWWECGMQWL